MKILAFDTAAGACSAALWDGASIAAHRHEAMDRGHAEALMPMIEAVLAESGAAYGELGAVAVTVGPGSFTGMRVGLAAARGIALARALPLLGLTTLESIAFAIADSADVSVEDRILAAVETRRADVFVQFFKPGKDRMAEAVSAPEAVAPEAVGDMLPPGKVHLGGDAAIRIAGALPGRDNLFSARGIDAPDAACIARLAALRIARDGVPDPSQRPGPLYINPPQATVPEHGGSLRP